MGFFNIPLVLWFVLLVANFLSKRYLQNHCPLVAKFGTKACRFAVGVCFAYVSYRVGGDTMLIFPVRRYFSLL
jgi:hypothetical protein